jgi:hypothetical protein
MPADDNGCTPLVSCPGSGPCETPTTTISTNRCQALGQCKTSAQCPDNDIAARTICGTEEAMTGGGEGIIVPICDGDGACRAPTVACLNQPSVTVTAGSCCRLELVDRGNIDPLGPTTSCEPSATGSITVMCDNQTDCPTGTICCGVDFGNFNYITCQETCPESGTNYRVCASPGGGSTACPGGRACNRSIEGLVGWSFCALP